MALGPALALFIEPLLKLLVYHFASCITRVRLLHELLQLRYACIFGGGLIGEIFDLLLETTVAFTQSPSCSLQARSESTQVGEDGIQLVEW